MTLQSCVRSTYTASFSSLNLHRHLVFAQLTPSSCAHSTYTAILSSLNLHCRHLVFTQLTPPSCVHSTYTAILSSLNLHRHLVLTQLTQPSCAHSTNTAILTSLNGTANFKGQLSGSGRAVSTQEKKWCDSPKPRKLLLGNTTSAFIYA